MNKVKETILEINLSHLTHNYNYLKSKIPAHTKLLAVVKARSYGSESTIIAKHLEKIGADYFAVAYTEEGIKLRQTGIVTPILVLHPQPINFESIIKYNLEPNLYSARVLNKFIEVAQSLEQQEYPIHLKFNTGLNRLGFGSIDIPSIVQLLKNTSAIKVTSLFSHLAASEDHNEKEFTQTQISDFVKISEQMTQGLGYQPILHQCNTSGILNYPEAHFDMVRTGIGIYGFGNEDVFDTELKPVAALKSIISQIHQLKPGETLGYNRAFVANQITKSATIPIGHADGINRIYGNQKGFVTINGQKAYILGNVCMDMIMVDVTNIDCNEGDEVIIFDHTIKASELAENAGTISYELITSISTRIKRCVIDDN